MTQTIIELFADNADRLYAVVSGKLYSHLEEHPRGAQAACQEIAARGTVVGLPSTRLAEHEQHIHDARHVGSFHDGEIRWTNHYKRPDVRDTGSREGKQAPKIWTS